MFNLILAIPDSKVHGTNMGPIWVLSAPDGPHIGPMNLAIRDDIESTFMWITAVVSDTDFLPNTIETPKAAINHHVNIPWQFPLSDSWHENPQMRPDLLLNTTALMRHLPSGYEGGTIYCDKYINILHNGSWGRIVLEVKKVISKGILGSF